MVEARRRPRGGLAGAAPRPLDERSRVRLAASPDTAADVLHALAVDPQVTVRAAVALNEAAPASADSILASDADERVRTLLASKLAALMPHADAAQRDSLRDQALTTLSLLVRDEAVRVRAAIAEVLKQMPDAPREIILRLARDSAVQVSEPVIRMSPMLTPEDLLGLLAEPSGGAAITAIACRAQLHEAVADAVAATADNDAIAALLRNQSAAIREATLDALIARASHVQSWHDPLVRRPSLSGRAARALSEMVATHLLEVLVSRGDLDPAIVAELRQRLGERLAAEREPEQSGAPPRPDHPRAQETGPAARGSLGQGAIVAAIRRGDGQSCAAILAARAKVPAEAVARAIELRSAKAIVSLAWSARMSMNTAMLLQTLLANIPPNALIAAAPGGGFPLAPDEMRWQIELLGGAAAR
jgi:uncharacterized protein (DUF2336 family)